MAFEPLLTAFLMTHDLHLTVFLVTPLLRVLPGRWISYSMYQGGERVVAGVAHRRPPTFDQPVAIADQSMPAHPTGPPWHFDTPGVTGTAVFVSWGLRKFGLGCF